MTWEYSFIAGALGLVGLIMGSFAGAQVWRLRARQLCEDKAAGHKVSATELKRLKPLLAPLRSDRSRCLSCGHTLHAIDLLPLVSWLSTGGRCRYCHERIGGMEPAVELGVATAFIVSFVAWPYLFDSTLAVLLFIVWLLSLVVAAVLFIYDLKWFLLPDRANYLYIGLAAVYSLGQLSLAGFSVSALLSLAGALVILSGLYALLYAYSKARYGEEHTWVGFGDVKLGLGLACFSMTWPLAFLGLFLANLIGTLLVLPGLLRGKLARTSHIPFGPLLLLGTFIAVLFGERIINFYVATFLF